MFTVAIYVNNVPIYTRTCRRVEGDAFNPDKCKYLVDTGDVIEHNYDDGAIVLANKLLATIKDTDDKPDKKSIKSRNKNILKSLTND